MSLLRNIDWSKIIEIDDFIFKRNKKEEKKERIRQAFHDLFFLRTNLKKKENINVDFLFVKSLPRDDYDELFYSIYNTCGVNKKKVLDIEYIPSKRIKLRPLYLFLKHLVIYKNAIRKNILDSIFLIIRITNYLEVYEKTRNYKFKHLVVFADMQSIDNLLVQIANLQSIPTVTLQHGLYIDYKDFKTENSVNYRHAVAKTFLAWGEDTAQLIRRHHPDINVEIVGKPLEQAPAKSKKDYFTVVFDSNYFFQHNTELLKLAYIISEKTELKVNLRLHPNNRLKWFKTDPDRTLVDEDILSSQFVVGHTTTILYECMVSGIPSFRFKTDKPSNTTPDELEFTNSDELMSILNNDKIRSLDFNKLSKNYFTFVSQESKNKYADFFHKLAIKEK